MATGGGAQVCPLCNAVVDGGDYLQLHYLTSCSGYDRGGVGGSMPSSSSSKPHDPPPPDKATESSRVTASPAATPSGVTPGNQCVVQFMWQPLTQMSYPKVTLLSSFESGSIDLTLDPDGGHYCSDQVTVASGIYDGQLVVGDSFIHPVKTFTVDSGCDIVVLEFDIGSGKNDNFASGGAGSGAEGDMFMQTNPSYNHTYNLGGRGGGGGVEGYQGGDAPYCPRRGKTGVAAGGGELATGRLDHYEDATIDLTGSPPPADPPHLNPRDIPPDTKDAYSHQLSDEGFDPAIVKSKTERNISYAVTDTAHQSSNTATAVSTVNGFIKGAGGTPGGGETETEHRATSTTEKGVLRESREKTEAGSGGVGVGRGGGGRGEGGEGGVGVGGAREKGTGGGGIEDLGVPVRTKLARDRLRGGFSVDSIHNHRTTEDTVVDYERRLTELEEELAKVMEEKAALHQDRERVSAQWEGKVRRLEIKLKEQKGEEEAEADIQLVELQTELDRVRAELEALSAKLEERGREMEFQEGQLKEMKNMNAALENQLTEYMDALDHQNKSVQHSIKTRQTSTAELAKVEQNFSRMAEFARKQQLEYQEALQSLQKKVGRAEEMERENLKIHQLNLNLTGELEDYRHQTKTLLADLRQREEEIAALQQSKRQFGNDRSQLELESMQQKCDAWREEVEKLSPLRDEVSHLQQENTRLQQDAARALHDNEGLARQLEEVIRTKGAVAGGLEDKGSEYDKLMERVTELQQIRVQLENELSPLRAERANILSENAALREGSQPEKYMQLKSNYAKLSEECVQLQKNLTEESNEFNQLRKTLTEESAINKKLEEVNCELQKQLQLATDEKALQAIRDRMERYKKEREQLRVSVAEIQSELQAYCTKEHENRETITTLRKALDEAVQQEQPSSQGQQLQALTTQLEEANKRMHRYREERNSAKIVVKSLQEQNATLQNTVQQLQNSYQYESYNSDASLLARLQLQDSVPTTAQELSTSPHEEQVEPYSPDEYSDHPRSSRSGSALRKHGKQDSGPTGPGGNRSSYAVGSRSSLGSSSGPVYADVVMKDGISRCVVIERPLYKLNPKQKPEVIVKRKGGNYETGVLAYLGVLDGKEMAGVILDFPSGSNDGSFKDGKFYFRCTQDHGLYCPLSNIYVEANSTTV